MQKALPGKTASSLLTRQRENDRVLGEAFGRSFFLFVVFIFSRFQHPKCDIECYMYRGDDQGQQNTIKFDAPQDKIKICRLDFRRLDRYNKSVSEQMR